MSHLMGQSSTFDSLGSTQPVHPQHGQTSLSGGTYRYSGPQHLKRNSNLLHVEKVEMPMIP